MSTHINREMDIKTESTDSDGEFDPMQFESTKMVILNSITSAETAGHAIETDTIKMEYDVKVENRFRPELLEYSHEVAYITPGIVLKPVKDEPVEQMHSIIGYVLNSNKFTNPSQILCKHMNILY